VQFFKDIHSCTINILQPISYFCLQQSPLVQHCPPTSPPFLHPGLEECSPSKIHDVTAFGAIPGEDGDPVANQAAINRAAAALQPCDTFFVPPSTFNTIGGIEFHDLRNNTLDISGQLNFIPDFLNWPMSPSEPSKKFADCVSVHDSINVVVTSSASPSSVDPQLFARAGRLEHRRH